MIQTPKRSFSLIVRLVLVLALINSVHGKSKKNKDGPGEPQTHDCPTQEDLEFPDSVRVQIHIAHANPSNTVPRDVSKRSVSPWKIRINHDPNRFPSEIAEASCLYQACVAASGQGLDYRMSSVPIQQEILVLRRQPTRGEQTYRLEKQMVTVGCTCAFHTTNTYLGRTNRTTKTRR